MSGRLISLVGLLALVLWLLLAGTAHSSTGDPPEIVKKYVGNFAPFTSTSMESRFFDVMTGDFLPGGKTPVASLLAQEYTP